MIAPKLHTHTHVNSGAGKSGYIVMEKIKIMLHVVIVSGLEVQHHELKRAILTRTVDWTHVV